jgi:maleylpyruvate isomerase
MPGGLREIETAQMGRAHRRTRPLQATIAIEQHAAAAAASAGFDRIERVRDDPGVLQVEPVRARRQVQQALPGVAAQAAGRATGTALVQAHVEAGQGDAGDSAQQRLQRLQGLVPALQTDGDDGLLIQSPAIIEWLEERHPQPPLLPADPAGRARVRALAAIVGCDIHPVNNRRILEALRHDFGADEAAVNRRCATWITAGFDAIKALLAADQRRGDFCFGNAPTLADVYLVPQVESARRFKVDMDRWPLISAVDAGCNRLAEFRDAAPAAQPDAG